jgi:hypothetical protein
MLESDALTAFVIMSSPEMLEADTVEMPHFARMT